MKIPFRYIFRSFAARRLTTAMTVLGIGLVVFVFAAVLMMANGIRQTLRTTGSDDNVLVLRKAANSETLSILDRSIATLIAGMPQVARSAAGSPLSSREPVVIINMEKLSGGMSNVTVRGVEPAAFELRPQVGLIEGKMFRWGAREIVVGRSIARRFAGAEVSARIKFAGDLWSVVGVLSSGGSGFDSEIWADSTQIIDSFKRSSYSTLTLRLRDPEAFAEFVKAFQGDNRLLQYEAKRESKFFEEQSEMMAAFIRILGLFITVIFSVGATIGAMITMYGAVANRTVEIGTLRALGFQRRSILAAFLGEAFMLSLLGAALGLAFASLLQFVTISTLNFNSFAEIAFSFALSPAIAASSAGFALAMGFLGGFLPAVRAARLSTVAALRAE
ncbi:MAG: multidrug ABC transporter permease [Deltaproteobacteria bacterium RIFCSPLOWO2_12_FULL_60_19]|nr:MAG: multidrug ABC transporter permease [Deltaproteobacteria bacterium RIFCSPLOWO2_12_FULL_60_19]